MACMFYFARCINIIFNLLLAQLVKYDVHTTRKIKFIHTIIRSLIDCCLYRPCETVTVYAATKENHHKYSAKLAHPVFTVATLTIHI